VSSAVDSSAMPTTPDASVQDLNLTLREILNEKSRELFNDYNVPCEPTDRPSGEMDNHLCGVLGFNGEQLKGSVSISAEPSAIAASNPMGTGATKDWVAELTNQLVGKFKHSLVLRGVEIALSIPISLQAARLVPAPERAAIPPIIMTVGFGSIVVSLEVEYGSLFKLLEESAGNSEVTMDTDGFVMF